MELTNNPNDRRRVDAEAQRGRDTEIAGMRRDGVPFRTIASRLGMSLGSVQKSLARTQKLAAVDGEMKAADAACVADIAKLSEVERYRLRHMPGALADVERARALADQRRWTQ